LSHEIRTPLATALFFLKQIPLCLMSSNHDAIQQAQKYFKLIGCQINFTMSFLDDLNDFRLLSQGAFALEIVAF